MAATEGVQALFRYQSRRHRFLMRESEQALNDAAAGKKARDKRIAQHVLGDSKLLRLWESRHAELIVPVAAPRARPSQVINLRHLEVQLLHRRALIRSIRKLGILGEDRDKLFSTFYGPRDTSNAILTEHRQYTLAVSSRVSADHLIDVMEDPVSVHLLRMYTDLYSLYFETYCKAVLATDDTIVAMYREQMIPLRRSALALIKRIHSERPQGGNTSLEDRVLLARSGRYPIRNYMVG